MGIEDLKGLLEEQRDAFSGFKAGLERRFEEIEKRVGRLALGGAGTGASYVDGGDKAAELKGLVDFVRRGETKAMTIGSGPEGGYTLAPQLDTEIMRLAAPYNPTRGLARVVKASSGDFQIPVATSEAASEWRGETQTRNTTAAPTFSMIRPPGGELSACPAITRWLMNDSAFDLGAFVIEYLGRAFGAAESTAIWSGTGLNQPSGLTTYPLAATADASRAFGTIEKLHSGTSADFDGDDLIALLFKLAPAYRAKAAWVVSTTALAKIRGLKASGSGEYLFAPGVTIGQPDMLLGRPIFECADVPAVGAASSSVWVGDWHQAYTLVDVGQPALIRDEITSKGNVLLWSSRRLHGAVVDSNAVKVLSLQV